MNSQSNHTQGDNIFGLTIVLDDVVILVLRLRTGVVVVMATLAEHAQLHGVRDARVRMRDSGTSATDLVTRQNLRLLHRRVHVVTDAHVCKRRNKNVETRRQKRIFWGLRKNDAHILQETIY